MKKILLIPTVVMTVFLAMAFVAPGVAKGVVGTVAPILDAEHANVPAVGFAENGAVPPANAEPAQSSHAAGALAPQTKTAQGPVDRGHDVATAGRVNCGRVGNGFHGGKHDFICPNKVFPPGS